MVVSRELLLTVALVMDVDEKSLENKMSDMDACCKVKKP